MSLKEPVIYSMNKADFSFLVGSNAEQHAQAGVAAPPMQHEDCCDGFNVLAYHHDVIALPQNPQNTAAEQDDFLWPQAQPQAQTHAEPSALGSEEVFFKLVAGNLRRHTFVGAERPDEFDCVCQTYHSFVASNTQLCSPVAYLIPSGLPKPSMLDRLSLAELAKIKVWSMEEAVGYVPAKGSNLTLVNDI